MESYAIDNRTQVISDGGEFGKYFHVLPNIYDDDLDPYEYRLIGHYRRVGTSYESTRTTAERTKMSVGKVSSTRRSLENKGLLRIQMVSKTWLAEHGYIPAPEFEDGNEICLVTLVDVALINAQKYQGGCSPHEQGGVHHMNQRSTTTALATPEDTAKEIKPDTPSVTDALPLADQDAIRKRILAGVQENCSGMITAMTVQYIDDDIKEYGAQLVHDAFIEAIKSKGAFNFNWKYVESILRRWQTEGRDAKRPDKNDPAYGLEFI